MDIASLGLAFVAGAVSTLSPCVLPLVPVVLGAAASEHRLGPVALASGLAVSFAAIGLFVATIGFSIGLDAALLRTAAAVLIVLFGVALAMPQLQERLAVAAGPVTGWAGNRLNATKGEGLGGQLPSVCCSAPYGAHVPGRRSAPPPCWRARVRISAPSPPP